MISNISNISNKFPTPQGNIKDLNQLKLTKKDKVITAISLCVALDIKFKPGGLFSGPPTATINKYSLLKTNINSVNELHDFIATTSSKINRKGELPIKIYDELVDNAKHILEPIVSYEECGNEDSKLEDYASMLLKVIKARTDNALYSSSACALMSCLNQEINAIMSDSTRVNEEVGTANKEKVGTANKYDDEPRIVYSNPGWDKQLVSKGTPNSK
jgi:hypothetical protein